MNEITPPRGVAPHKPARPLFERDWFIILASVLFFPVGAFLIWLTPHWRRETKIIAAAVCAPIFVCALVQSRNTPDPPKPAPALAAAPRSVVAHAPPKKTLRAALPKPQVAPTARFPLLLLAGKTRRQVRGILGKPKGHDGEFESYRRAGFEEITATYNGGRLCDVIAYFDTPIAGTGDALGMCGVRAGAPSETAPAANIYHGDFGGFSGIRLVRDLNGTGWNCIQASTPQSDLHI